MEGNSTRLTFILPVVTAKSQLQINLAEVVNFVTDIPGCGAQQLTSYRDAQLRIPTTS